MAEQMEVAVVESRWNDLSEDLKKSIFARLQVEFVYTYRILCKEWNALLSSKHFLSRMWAEAPSNNHGYEDVRFVEIYDSSERTWKIAGYLPQDLRLFIPDHFEGNHRMVYCDGSFYILGNQPEIPLGIAGFSMPSNGNGGAETPVSVLLAPFPQVLLNDRLSSPRLIKCRSRLLIVAVMREGISIWEFENDHRRLIRSSNSSSWRWQEIAKTPASMWEDFLRTTILVNLEESIECIGVGDHVCVLPQGTHNIPNQEGLTALVYNLTEHSWRWTTRSPNNHRYPLDVLPHNHTSITFKPFE